MREEINNWLRQANLRDYKGSPNMDKQSIQIASTFAKKLKKAMKVQKIILFGSRARGDHLKNSDFDFIIVSKEFAKKPFILRASNLYDYWGEQVDIESLCYTPEEFERKKKQKGIVQQAVKEGIEL